MNQHNTIGFFEQFKGKKFITLSKLELNELIGSSTLILEQDTHIRDMIRIVKMDGHYYLIEKTNLDELIMRQFDSETNALKLLNERMEIYDKMWDGCGCKINYYE